MKTDDTERRVQRTQPHRTKYRIKLKMKLRVHSRQSYSIRRIRCIISLWLSYAHATTNVHNTTRATDTH